MDENEYKDDDEMNEEGFDQAKLRKYELNKMKYFYAVIHCNTKKTAKKIYEEYNGFEFELSNTRLNLSFISDSLTFPQKPKEAATEVPPDYEFKAINNLNKALNHTKVKLTWEQTDPKRQQKLEKISKKGNLEDEEFREFVAETSEEEEEDDEDDEKNLNKIEEYRNKLLGALKGSDGDIFRKRDLHERAENGDKDLEIKFNVGFGEDVGKKLLAEKKEKKELQHESEWQKY